MVELKTEVNKIPLVVILTIIISSIVLIVIFNLFAEIPEGEINEGAFMRINVVYASIALFFVTWAIFLSYEKLIEREIRMSIPTENIIVSCSIILLVISYFIPDVNEPVINFYEINSENYLKAIISLGVVLFTPGWFITNFFLKRKDFILKNVLSILISIILVAGISIFFYWQNLDFIILKFLFLPIIIGLWLITKKFKRTSPSITMNIDRWSILMALAIGAVVSIAWAIHSSHNLMIVGDNWTTLLTSVYIQNSGDIYDSKSDYPIIWSFIVVGLSSVSGLPPLNTNSLLFPLAALVMLSFYLLGKYALELKQKVLITSVLVYSFLGGLGWIVLQFGGSGRTNYSHEFWQLSYETLDIYFQHNFWNNFNFNHIQLSLALAFVSISLWHLSIKSTGRERIFFSTLSAFFISFAFYTHILEALYVIPILLFMTIYYYKNITKPILFAFFVTTIILFLFIQVGTNGYYFYLFEFKAEQLLKKIDLDLTLFVAVGFFALITVKAKEKISNTFFYFVGGGIFLIYVLGFYFWSIAPAYDGVLYIANQVPWYYFSTRFGIVGLLAISALFFGAHKEKWSRIGVVWIITLLIIGNIWWGARMTTYLLPVIAIAASYTIIALHDKFMNFTFFNKNKLRRNLAILPFLAIIIISSSSYMYGVSHYVYALPDVDAQNIDAIRWIFHNAPKDSAVLVPNNYEIEKAFSTMSLHKTIKIKDFDWTKSTFQHFITSKNIKYTYGIDNPTIFSEYGYELNYIKKTNSTLSKLVLIDYQK